MKLKIEFDGLPPGWEVVRLGDMCTTTSGGTPSRKNVDFYNGNIPWVKSGELPDGPIEEIKEGITEEAIKKSSAKVFPRGTLLIALYGATVGKLGILNCDAATNQAVCAVFTPEGLARKYLFWYLRAVRSDLVSSAVGGAQPNISQTILRELIIPVAPFEQQTRIVAEIEKQFSRLDEAVANLKRVKANLKRYNAAVLKAAVEGKLTEEWRRRGAACCAQDPDHRTKAGAACCAPTQPTETGAELLERILEERRSNWQGRGKYKEPVAPDTSGLPELPEGWVWASFDQISGLDIGFAFKSAEFESRGIKLLRGENIEPGALRWVDTRCWPENKLGDYKDLLINEGDIILAMDRPLISSGLKIARAKQQDLPCLLVQRMARFKPLAGIDDYIFLVMQERGFVRHLLGGQTGTQLPHISGKGILSFSCSLPSLAEQNQIVAEVERRLSIITDAETQIDANLHRADRLRQSILKQAFSGQLVPQNPDDEPASVLLERIGANADGAGATRRVARKRSTEGGRGSAGKRCNRPNP